MKGRTTFIIAHRLSTITNADKIIVMDKGEVQEIGPIGELLHKRGVFYKMFMEQYGRVKLSADIVQHLTTNREHLAEEKKPAEVIGD